MADVPTSPVVFMKPNTALNHPGAPIVLPAACEHGPEVDFEAELGVIIGRTARDVSEADALDHVLGYTCANDVSARRWQKHGGGGQSGGRRRSESCRSRVHGSGDVRPRPTTAPPWSASPDPG